MTRPKILLCSQLQPNSSHMPSLHVVSPIPSCVWQNPVFYGSDSFPDLWKGRLWMSPGFPFCGRCRRAKKKAQWPLFLCSSAPPALSCSQGECGVFLKIWNEGSSLTTRSNNVIFIEENFRIKNWFKGVQRIWNSCVNMFILRKKIVCFSSICS